jgi:hypothetical protein
MGLFRTRVGLVGAAIGLAATGFAALPAAAQTSRLNHLPPARAPCSVLSGRPCHPSFCGVFHRGPCFPQFEAPLGETLQLTITSTDDNDPANKHAGEPEKNSGADARDKAATDRAAADDVASDHPDAQTLDTIRAMFDALRGCWVPPPKDEAWHGMEYTIRFAFKRDGEMIAPPRMTYASHDASAEVRTVYRDAIEAALKRCVPLHFSDGMGGAVAGRPIAIRFVDDRTIDNASAK